MGGHLRTDGSELGSTGVCMHTQPRYASIPRRDASLSRENRDGFALGVGGDARETQSRPSAAHWVPRGPSLS